MKTRGLIRRDFLKGAGLIGLGSSVFFLVLPRQSARWAGAMVQRSLLALGTQVNIVIFDTPDTVANEAVKRAFREIEEIHWLMSTHDPASQLSLVNQVSGSELVQVDPRIIDVVKRSLDFSRQSSGVFDATTYPLLGAWGFRNYRFDQPPDETQVQAALDKVDYQQVVITDAGVGLKRKGAGIDLGGIAKGYAVDRACDILRVHGIRRFLIEAGGDLFAAARPPDSPHWNIGLKHPLREGLCATLFLDNQAVATSGTYESYVNYGGRRYGHLFNPFTGEPVDTYLSTSAVAPTALEADGASTTLFVAGRKAAPSLVSRKVSWLHLSPDTQGKLTYHPSAGFPPWEELS